MVRIKQYQQQVNAEPVAHEYLKADSQGAFGEQLASAYVSLGESVQNVQHAVLRYNDQQNRTKALELSNELYKWEEEKLNSKNGYYNQFGRNASGKAQFYIDDFDNYARTKAKEIGLDGLGSQQYVEFVINKRKEKISRGIMAHDLKQTQEAEKNEAGLLLQNLQNSAIEYRNNDFELDKNIEDIKKASNIYGKTANLDDSQIKLLQLGNVSDTLSKVIQSALAEGNLRAKVLFDKYKDKLTPDEQVRLSNAVNNLDNKYMARDFANKIILNSANEADAISKAEKIENIELSDMVLSNVRKHFSQVEQAKNEQQRQAREQFYNIALQKLQNGQALSWDDIPADADAETKLSMMNYVNKNGQPETDNQIWQTLYDMSVNNAQGFANEDLNKYRGFISDGEFKQFLKRQQEIKDGKYYSVIQDDNKLIDAALKEIGLDSGKKEDVAYSEIRAFVREYEARKGRKINDEEIQNIINSLGYKNKDGIKTYKVLEKGMAEKTGFIKDIVNDFVYYQNQHNGELPSDDEKFKIIQKRIEQKQQEKRSTAQQKAITYDYNAQIFKNISNTAAKPNEQKVLTYFADNQIPQTEKDLGLKLTVTSRYRNQAGSHHSEGLAADVSMSEHNINNRIRIYEKFLAMPNVYRLGTSDVNILTHFAGNKKIVDERKYDMQHGTNHVNHVHVTLLNPNTQVVNNDTKNKQYRL